MKRDSLAAVSIAACSVFLLGASADPCANVERPTQIDYAMYFMSDVRDSSECAMEVVDGEIVVASAVTNPAMSCPDMWSWKLLLEAIDAEFWTWATDEDTWPEEPLAACTAAGSGPCCTFDPASDPGDRGEHCPFFPAAHRDEPGDLPASARPPSKAHAIGLEARLHVETDDPGRVIRQEMAEAVYRNRPMFDYVVHHNLYHANGLAAAFAAYDENIPSHAPYRLATGDRVGRIDFPVDSVMIKSNWIEADLARELGLADTPQAPYVRMAIVPQDGSTPTEHWLVALHVSSKDVPEWVWATFEHVGNPGRCDYTGCNDSYGYASPDDVPAGRARNYTRPRTRCDGLGRGGQGAQEIFDLGTTYTDGDRSEGLATMLAGLGIGTAPAAGGVPSPADEGWRSYRLKGSQVGFTTSTGRPTHLGNSITEGGFVTSSSCISCHARANTGPEGASPPTALGVFVTEVDETGYSRSAFGPPVPSWYHRSSAPPATLALPTDFVWGFLNAQPLVTEASGASAEGSAPTPRR